MQAAAAAVSTANSVGQLAAPAQVRRVAAMAVLDKLAQLSPETTVGLVQPTLAQAVAEAVTPTTAARVAQVLLSSAIWALQPVPVAR